MSEFKINGLQELIFDLGKFGDAAMPYLKTASNEAGKVVLEKAKQKATEFKHPTGNLRSKLYVRKARKIKPGVYKIQSQVSVKKGAAYYIPLELGHAIRNKKNGKSYGKVEGKPFLRPAADESKAEVTRIITKAMEKALKDLGD